MHSVENVFTRQSISRPVNKVDVSVLLPTTGRNSLLESISSVLASEGLKNLEIVLIDDSEKQDLNLDIEKVIIKRTGGNKGYLEALSLGAMQAKYEYIAIMNDDDLISSDRLIKQANILAINKVGFCITKLKKFKTGEKYVGKMLTVIYQELTEEGKPRFPVGKDVRENY